MKKSISRIALTDYASKSELFAYLRKNEGIVIAQKRAFPIMTDDLDFGYNILSEVVPFASKATGTAAENPNELKVDIIGNLSGWCDSYMDVMIKDNWNKSISDLGASGQKLVYHLKNHDYSTDSIVGKDATLYSKMIDLSIFNLTTDVKKAQALMMSSTVMREYDSKCFMLYRDKQVKQHSIGLQYIKIFMCMDSEEPEDAQYKENWDKYYPDVINKEKVNKSGYFFAVTESKIIEVSVVLFGANELTPVESMEGKAEDTPIEPPVGTQSEPLKTEEPIMCRWEKMAAQLTA